MSLSTRENELLAPQRDFFIGLDSDGCVFDSMEIKHRDCFCPVFIEHYGLETVAPYAREVWDFVNLRSRSRGCNRFIALVLALDLLRERRELRENGIAIPAVEGLESWTRRERALGQPAIEAELAQDAMEPSLREELERALAWSRAVNAAVEKRVSKLPPFSPVAEFLAQARGGAELRVVSQTPREALLREWRESGLLHLIDGILAQEEGSKERQLKTAALPFYEKGRVLLIGDTLGDLEAATSAGVHFFPIPPGREEEAWRLLRDEALTRFFEGSYAGAYEEGLLADFVAGLPSLPPWLS